MGLLLYPNPAANWMRVLLPEGSWQLDLLDGSGRHMLRQSCSGGTACTLDLHGLSAGTYLLRARDGQREMVGKVVNR